MIQRHKRFLLLIAAIVGSSLLSACSGIQSPPSSADVSPIQPVSPISVAKEYPDLVPIPTESEMCLQRELEALRHTGAWENGVQPPADSTVGGAIQYDFPVLMNKQVQMYIDLFQNEERGAFSNWLSRSKRYLPVIRKDLKSAGLPLDLAYLAMIESGFNQRAYSTAQATGLWQFMSDTAKQYNLRVDRYVDQRRDAEKSTKAAVAMLSDLYHQFGDWYLAVAAYNAGAGKISAGLKKYNVSSFWDLARKQYLNLETIRYVPELMAAIIVARDPEKYGFSNINYLHPLQYDTLEVGPGLGLEGLALITHSSKEELQLLNEDLITGKTPPTNHKFEVKIPAGTRDIALNNLPHLRSIASLAYKTHVLGRHESLASICRKFNISRTELLKVNRFRHGRLLAGQHLRIPVTTVHYRLVSGNEALARNDSNRILHTIRSGETIAHIARQYHLDPKLILAWNNIKHPKDLQIGQKLTLFVADKKETGRYLVAETRRSHISTALATGRHKENGLMVLVAHRKNQPMQTARAEFKYYRIENGDTLWTISQKFRTSPKQIKDWNNLKSNVIHPGDKLKVKEPNPIVAEEIENTVL